MLRKMLTRKMLTILCLGLASGIPLGIVLTVLQAWMTKSGIDLKTVGLAVLVQMPYTWKFAWSPLMDRFVPPFLGRRRGWMLVSQVLMLVSIVAMGQFDPARAVGTILALATVISFAGASHDIVIDAYRRDVLDESELGFGSAVAVNSYLIGFRYIGVVLGLFLGDVLPWSQVFMILAAFVLVGVVGTLIAIEPRDAVAAPRSLREAVFSPFLDYLKRPGAIEILLFILLYKLGDNLASALLTPFYIKIGFSLKEISVYYKIISFWGTFTGGLVGGALLTRYSIRKCLLAFGVFQGITPLAFSLLVTTGPNVLALAFVVAVETLSLGMGASALTTFMLRLCNRKFSATQYALLTSFMGIPRTIIPASAGFIVDGLGWVQFYVLCVFLAIPGLLLVYFRAPKWEEGLPPA
ncbi:MAG TPA: AmpG family muropeptide MFS transporter [Vicinamibacterales bacterium]|jgi:PAT family beta-lactamase induction signal transducer AmpG